MHTGGLASRENLESGRQEDAGIIRTRRARDMPPDDATCLRLLSAAYTTQHEPNASRWHQRACPWEETRHSAYFPTKFSLPLKAELTRTNAKSALRFATARMAMCGAHNLVARLSGLRLFVVGDSLMRQFVQAILCQLHAQFGRVESDRMMWVDMAISQFGRCAEFSGSRSRCPASTLDVASLEIKPSGNETCETLRHCYMKGGCVSFPNDNKVCYMKQERKHGLLWATSWLRDWMGKMARAHPGGQRHVAVIASGVHRRAQWQALENNGTAIWKAVEAEFGASKPPIPFEVVYKDMDAQHFPTLGGVYLAEANHTSWHCSPLIGGDVSMQRRNEVEFGLPLMRTRLPGWSVLSAFEADAAHGAFLHSTFAPVPSKKTPVDCTHWLVSAARAPVIPCLVDVGISLT